MKKRILLLLAAIAACMFVACQRRPLEAVYSTTVRVIVKVIWQTNAMPEEPTGVTLYFFRDGDAKPRVITTSNIEGCEVQLEPGRYKLFMITQSPEEYWTMEFDDMNDFDSANATLEKRSSRWYTTRADEEALAENPENIAVAVAEDFEITDDMVEEYQYYYRLWRSKTKALGLTETKSMDYSHLSASDQEELRNLEDKIITKTIVIPLYPENIVSQFWVTVYAKNADVLKSVRAATNGMARTFELTQDVTSSETVTQLIESEWTLTMDDTETRVGHVDGMISTFGLPNGDSPSALRDPSLNLSALLIDNKTQADFVFPVGDKIRLEKPNPGYRNMYRLIFGSADDPIIELPDVQGEGSSSGMDATVSDWDDGETVEIPI